MVGRGRNGRTERVKGRDPVKHRKAAERSAAMQYAKRGCAGGQRGGKNRGKIGHQTMYLTIEII